MPRFPLSLALVSLTAFALSCTGGRGANGTDGNDCTVTEDDGTAVLKCEDGTEATITDGKAGPAGTNGTDGESGATGFDGVDGVDGADSLLVMTDEPAGSHCPSGGTRIESGLDENLDGTLTPTEVEYTKYVCNAAVASNGLSALVRTSKEPAGLNCLDGGIRIDTGLDDNGNTALDSFEVDQTQYLCETLCTVTERAFSVPATDHASLDYVGTQTWNDNVLRVETDGSDVVGWIGFDLANVPDNSVVLGAKLFLRHDAEIDATTTDNPTVQVLLGTANHFTQADVTTTNMPKGPAVSTTITAFTADGWTEIALTIPPTALATDRDDDYLTLGLDETTAGNRFIAFYGSADASTRPYVELTLVSCQ